MAKGLDLVGKEFGRLTVISLAGTDSKRGRLWHCKCTCGNVCIVLAASLNAGLISSCGCLYKESRKTCNKTHGKSKSREYNAWQAAKQRCYYEQHDFYADYGGRGITMCDEWLQSFETFYKDMGDCPEGMSIERIDSDGNYCPENCKWDTNSNQGYNTRKHSNNTSGKSGVHWHKLTSKWAASIGVNNETIHLGVYSNLEDAIEARKEAELKYYGRNKE